MEGNLTNLSEDEAKRRFALFAIVRLGAVAMMLFGIAVALTSLIRTGGWPLLGAVIAVIAVANALMIPRVMRRQWDKR